MGGLSVWVNVLLVTSALLVAGLVANLVLDIYRYKRDTRATSVPPLGRVRQLWDRTDLALAYLETQHLLDEFSASGDPHIRWVGRVAKVRSQAALEQGRQNLFDRRGVRFNFLDGLNDLAESVGHRSKTLVYQSLLNLCLAIGFGEEYVSVAVSAEHTLTETDHELMADLRACGEFLQQGDHLSAYDVIMAWADFDRLRELHRPYLLALSLLRDRIVVGAEPPHVIGVSVKAQKAGLEAIAALVDQVVPALEKGNYARVVDLIVADQEALLARK